MPATDLEVTWICREPSGSVCLQPGERKPARKARTESTMSGVHQNAAAGHTTHRHGSGTKPESATAAPKTHQRV